MMTRAFTLIETIIIIAITTLMLLAISMLYINFNSLYVDQQTSIATVSAASGAITAIGGATLPASHILASHVFSGGSVSSGTTALVLELPTVDASGNIVSGRYDYIAFYLTGTDLYRLIEADATSIRLSGVKRVAALVSSLAFIYDDADFAEATSVAVDITTLLNTKKGPVQTQLQQQFYLRNI